MSSSILPIGTLIVVLNYSPFRGLKGTVLASDLLADEPDEPLGFYLVALEGTAVPEPIWFECDEVEPVGYPPSHSGRRSRRQARGRRSSDCGKK
jgi:hypothetical protein